MTLELDDICFRPIFDNAPNAMLIVDDGGRIILFNSAASILFGYDPKRLESLPVEMLMPLRFRGTPWKNRISFFREGKEFRKGSQSELFLLDKAGREFPADIFVAPLSLDGTPYTLATIDDLTEFHLTRAALLATHTRQQAILSAIPEIITEVDVEKRYLWANRAGLEFFGDDMIGREAGNYFVGNQNTYEIIAPLFQDGTDKVYVESWQRRRDGEPCLLAWYCVALRNEEGRITGALSSGRDITVARQIEEKMKKQRALLERMSSMAKIGGWDFDVATMKGSWTDEVARIHDLDPSVPATVSLGLHFFHGKSRLKIESAIRKAIKQAIPYDLELEMVSAKGIRKWVRTCGIPVMEGGKVIRIEGTIKDITDRKQTDGALRASEAAFESVFNASLAGIGIRRMNDGKFIAVNDSFLDIYGYRREEVIGYDSDELDLWFNPDQRRHTFNRLKKQGKLPPFKLQGVRKTGEIVTLLASATKISMRNEDCALIILMDISEQERMEKAIDEQRKEMNELFKRQIASHTASAIAHELNQPLLAIAAYSEAAIRMIDSGSFDKEKLLGALKSAVQQTKRAGQSLHEMMNFLSKTFENAEIFDLNREILNALAIVGSRAGEAFESRLDLEAGLLPVQAYRIHIHKVLLNLLDNSIEAMEGSGMRRQDMILTVHTKTIGNFVQVSIMDNGPGLENVDQIFTTFYSTKHKGMGVGLAISRALIEDHGGKLWAYASKGRGAIFHFTLPVAK